MKHSYLAVGIAILTLGFSPAHAQDPQPAKDPQSAQTPQAHILPEGWTQWRKGDGTDKTARYAEYASTGPGANPDRRVPWSKQLTKEQADPLTDERLLAGMDGWKP